MRKLLTLIVGALALTAGSAQAQNLLTNGALDAPIPPPAFDGWTLLETVTGEPATPINSAQVQDFADQDPAPGGTGLWLRPFEGNIGPNMGLDKAINAYLTQTVAGSAGLTYTFSGYSRWEANYSGGVANLDADKVAPPDMAGPPSPTDTTMRLEFLNAGNAVIGSGSLDLRTVQMNNNTWVQHTLMGAAPAGTASVRVTAEATDMKFNVDPGQSAFYDTFSLTDSGAPATERLTNGGLNLGPPQPPVGWSLTESGGDTANPDVGFADNPPGPGLGLWLRPFVTTVPNGDATLSQTVSFPSGRREITFSGYSRWEANYSGGIVATPTDTLLEMQFLDAANNPVGAPVQLDLRTEQMNDNTWRFHDLSATAPLGATQVRVSAIGNDMFNTMGAQSAFFDDFSLTAIPEPTTFALLGLGLVGVLGLRRRS